MTCQPQPRHLSRSLATVNNPGGYTSRAPSPIPPPCLSVKRPSLTSILKNHRADTPIPQYQTPQPRPRSQSAQIHRSTSHKSPSSDLLQHQSPIPNHRNTATFFNQFFTHDTRSSLDRTFQPRNLTMWRAGAQDAPLNSATITIYTSASATLPTQPFAIDFAETKTTRQHTQTYITILFASTAPVRTTTAPNATSRNSNRRPTEPSQTIDHSPPTSTPPPRQTLAAPSIATSTTDTIVAAVAYPKVTMHRLDFTYNSPNVANMNPGNPYCQWFHITISRSHYSLGEATDHYNQWISDPDYGPNPLSHSPNAEPHHTYPSCNPPSPLLHHQTMNRNHPCHPNPDALPLLLRRFGKSRLPSQRGTHTNICAGHPYLP